MRTVRASDQIMLSSMRLSPFLPYSGFYGAEYCSSRTGLNLLYGDDPFASLVLPLYQPSPMLGGLEAGGGIRFRRKWDRARM